LASGLHALKPSIEWRQGHSADEHTFKQKRINMTIGAAWIAGDSESQQLWFATDSRLSGDGNVWDDCPKIMPLPRRDAIAAFSGDTAQAYPLLLQCSNAIGSYTAASDGTLEFFQVMAHLQRVMNSMMDHVHSDPYVAGVTTDRPFSSYDDAIVIGGYSRQHGKLVIQTLRHQPNENQWRFDRVRSRIGAGQRRIIAVFGDSRARNRFVYLLTKHLKDNGTHGEDIPLRLEPLEVMALFLGMPESRTDHRWPMDRRSRTIGGAPQVIQLYPGAQATPLAVHWDSGGVPGVFIMGRRAFSYEHLDVPLITFSQNGLRIHARNNWPAEIREPAEQQMQGQQGDAVESDDLPER
jgi:hypothetical protein